MQAENVQLHTIQPRMKNPAVVIPEANSAIQDLIKATFKGSSSEVRQASSFDPRTRLVINLTIPGAKH